MGEGQEAHDAAVKAGEGKVYTEKMTELEDNASKVMAEEIYGRGDSASPEKVEEARDLLRRRGQFEAGRENKRFDKTRADLGRPLDEAYSEAKALQYFADARAHGEDRGVTSEDYSLAADGVERTQDRAADGDDLSAKVLADTAESREMRDMIAPELKAVILSVAKDKFADYFGEIRSLKAAMSGEKMGTFKYTRISDEYNQLLDSLEKEVLTDGRLVDAIGDKNELSLAVKKWARRFYSPELDKFVDSRLGADNYSI